MVKDKKLPKRAYVFCCVADLKKIGVLATTWMCARSKSVNIVRAGSQTCPPKTSAFLDMLDHPAPTCEDELS